MRVVSFRSLLVGMALLMGCAPPAASEGAPSTSLAAAAGVEWQLQVARFVRATP
jgi:hypothetical protein